MEIVQIKQNDRLNRAVSIRTDTKLGSIIVKHESDGSISINADRGFLIQAEASNSIKLFPRDN